MTIVYPDSININVETLSKKKLKRLLKEFKGTKSKTLKKKLTARTYQLNNNKFIIEFYDKQGILINNKKDYELLKGVCFIKNSGYIQPNISYYWLLTTKEAKRIISKKNGKHLEKYVSLASPVINFKVYELVNRQVILIYEDGEGYLYENIEALASNLQEVSNILSQNRKDDLIKAIEDNKLNINNYDISPSEEEELIKNHELKLLEKGIFLEGHCHKRNLYLSKFGYYLLISDFNQQDGYTGNRIEQGKITKYLSLKAFKIAKTKYENYLMDLKNPEKLVHHMYQGISNEYGEQFPQHTNELIGKLPELLNIEESDIRFTTETIEIINEAIQWNYSEEKINDIFPSLLAFTGESYKNRGQGDWKMTLDKEGKTWEPWFIGNDGDSVFDIFHFYKNFFECEYGFPILD